MTTVAATLAERGSRYGEFADHAKVAQGIQDVMRAHPNWDKLDLDMKQALSVIADKIARIINGDPYYLDNWHDLSGYATLIENRLKMILDNTMPELYGEPVDAEFIEAPEESYYVKDSPITAGGFNSVGVPGPS